MRVVIIGLALPPRASGLGDERMHKHKRSRKGNLSVFRSDVAVSQRRNTAPHRHRIAAAHYKIGAHRCVPHHSDPAWRSGGTVKPHGKAAVAQPVFSSGKTSAIEIDAARRSRASMCGVQGEGTNSSSGRLGRVQPDAQSLRVEFDVGAVNGHHFVVVQARAVAMRFLQQQVAHAFVEASLALGPGIAQR